MIPLYTSSEFDDCKSRGVLPLKCEQCGNTFHAQKRWIQVAIKHQNKEQAYCSPKCLSAARSSANIDCVCAQCQMPFRMAPSQFQKHKIRGFKNKFCSRVCATQHTNTHKTTGHHRSKLERWLERQLAIKYPDLEILYNDSLAIGAELDFYVPSLAVAFELNGPFHYEPIFGQKKLDATQNSDKRKFHLCVQHKIDLCVIDASKHRYFKEQNCKPYLDIITAIIDDRMAGPKDAASSSLA